MAEIGNLIPEKLEKRRFSYDHFRMAKPVFTRFASY